MDLTKTSHFTRLPLVERNSPPSDREIDAVIQFPDGAWGAFEVKLGMAQVDEAAANLVDLASAFSKNPPRSLAVVVGLAGAAYRRPDGVYVLPLTALGPK